MVLGDTAEGAADAVGFADALAPGLTELDGDAMAGRVCIGGATTEGAAVALGVEAGASALTATDGLGVVGCAAATVAGSAAGLLVLDFPIMTPPPRSSRAASPVATNSGAREGDVGFRSGIGSLATGCDVVPPARSAGGGVAASAAAGSVPGVARGWVSIGAIGAATDTAAWLTSCVWA